MPDLQFRSFRVRLGPDAENGNAFAGRCRTGGSPSAYRRRLYNSLRAKSLTGSVLITEGPMASCEECEILALAAFDASRAHHNLLTVLEAVHICHDAALTLGIQQRVAKALRDRDEAISALNDHEGVHTKQAGG
jgi:hypothetical protein